MASLRSKFEEHLTCSVCLEQLKDPKVLPCLHSFCHKCIVNIAKKGKSNNINCPECRKVVQVDNPDNPSNLPSNFFVNNLLATMALTDEKKEQKIQCDNCTDENSAATRCEECAVFLCSYCSEFHKKSRPTKHHVLTTLQELKSGAGPLSVAEKIRCEKHKDELIKLYCKTCQSTICRDCTIVEHRTHDYGFIEDVAVGQKEILKRNMNEVQQRQATLQRAIAILKLFDQSLVEENALVIAQVASHFDEFQRIVVSKKNELISKARSLTDLKRKQIHAQVASHFDEFQRIVVSKKNELISKARSLTDLKRKQIHAQIEALEVALASCKSSIEFTDKAFKNGNDVQVLSMQKYILQSLQDLKKVKDVTQPCVTRDLRFSIPWSIEDTEKNLLSYFAVDESSSFCYFAVDESGSTFKTRSTSFSEDYLFWQKQKRVKNGGQVVQANISGVKYDDATMQDNKNGTHTVTFTPRRGGTLKFEATIDGRPAPGCSLTKDVTWVLSNDYGNGELSDGGLRNKTNQGRCWRIGECSFESGVHSWKVLVKANTRVYRRGGEQFTDLGSFYASIQPAQSVCNVGVCSRTDGRDAITSQVRCQQGEEVTVTVILNIPSSTLVIESNGRVEEKINIKGVQFWPFFQFSGNDIEVILKYD